MINNIQIHKVILSQEEVDIVVGGSVSIWPFVDFSQEKIINFFGSYGLFLAIGTVAATYSGVILSPVLAYTIYAIGAGSIVYKVQQVYGAPCKTCEAGFLGAMGIFMFNQVIRITHQK